jgi:glycosyltransferase involved in cell wall biosynthesis
LRRSEARLSILLVTKPLAPPWHDSSSGLARSLVAGLLERGDAPALRVLVGDRPSGFAGLTEEVIYPSGGSFAPGMRQNLPVLLRLFRSRGESGRHFFFAPNRRSGAAARLAALIQKVPVVHTLCSLPAPGRTIAPSLFADRHIVVSAWAQRRLEQEGVEAEVIEPAVLPLQANEAAIADCRCQFGDYILFAGDLRPGGGASEALQVLKRLPAPLRLVIAARPKTAADTARREALVAEVEALGLSERVTFLGRVDFIAALVCAARLQLLPATDLTAKMDLPMVLLEGFAAGVPAVVASTAPIAEISDYPGALLAAPADDFSALTAASSALLDGAKEAAITLYAARFTPALMAARYAALYRSLGMA